MNCTLVYNCVNLFFIIYLKQFLTVKIYADKVICHVIFVFVFLILAITAACNLLPVIYCKVEICNKKLDYIITVLPCFFH